MRRAARGALALTVVAAAGCGQHVERATDGDRLSSVWYAETPPTQPRPYSPSARHRHRPPHSIFNDEIGEDVVGTPYGRIVALFGTPLARRGTRSRPCVYYAVVGERNGWEFCFRNGRMYSAGGNTRRRDFARP